MKNNQNYIKIVKEPNEILRKKCEEVTFPLSNYYKFEIERMFKYLKDSQNEETAKQKNLRAGVGLAAPQVGIKKRFFVIAIYDENNEEIYKQEFINPKILNTSKNLIYLEKGEGCLSVDDSLVQKVLRYEEIKVEYTDMTGEVYEETLTDFLAVVFQHEYDHLDGIMFYDKSVTILQENQLKKARKI